MRRAAIVSAVVLCACSGSFGDGARESFHQVVAAGSAPVIHVENVAGAVRVDAWPKTTVDVAATKYARDAGALRDIRIGVRKEGSDVFIETSYGGGIHSGGVRYRLFVPAGSSLQIHNVAGSVELTGVRGNIDVETQAGEITADAGRVTGDRSIDLRATTGAVTLSVASESDATVTASSTVGAFTSDVPGISQRRENLVGASGSGTIGSGSARIRITTTTGAIALRQRSM
jgi:Putative adhesin